MRKSILLLLIFASFISCMPTETLLKLNQNGSGTFETTLSVTTLAMALSEFNESRSATPKEVYEALGVLNEMVGNESKKDTLIYIEDLNLPIDTLRGRDKYLNMVYLKSHEELINAELTYSIGISFSKLSDLDSVKTIIKEMESDLPGFKEQEYMYGLDSYFPSIEINEKSKKLQIGKIPYFEKLSKEEECKKLVLDSKGISEFQRKFKHSFEIHTPAPIKKYKHKGNLISKNHILIENYLIEILTGKGNEKIELKYKI